MKKELDHFRIGNSYGGNQDWFRTFMMRIGGCGAETACDSSIYFALHKGIEEACPFDPHELTRKQYVDFAHMMEKYLWPRMTGIDSLDIYIDGYLKYLSDMGVTDIGMHGFDGTEPYEKAAETVREQIDKGLPLPALVLNHRNRRLKDYVWHWFLINGYDERPDGRLMVKAVTYSNWEWIDLEALWDTGYVRRGGLVIYEVNDRNEL